MERQEVQRGLKIVQESARAGSPPLRPTLSLDLDLGLDSMQRVELLSIGQTKSLAPI